MLFEEYFKNSIKNKKKLTIIHGSGYHKNVIGNHSISPFVGVIHQQRN
jgi:hypothetical protein